jgi:hypothetical protein
MKIYGRIKIVKSTGAYDSFLGFTRTFTPSFTALENNIIYEFITREYTPNTFISSLSALR